MSNDSQLDQFAEALEAGDTAEVQALLAQDRGLALAVLPDGWPVFLLQSVYPKAEIIDLLIGAGADPNARNPAGETLLHLTGDPAMIRKLLSVGAQINARDHRGRTPMMGHAPHYDTALDAIHTLLAEGADPSVIDADGVTLSALLPEGGRFDALRRRLQDS